MGRVTAIPATDADGRAGLITVTVATVVPKLTFTGFDNVTVKLWAASRALAASTVTAMVAEIWPVTVPLDGWVTVKPRTDTDGARRPVGARIAGA